MKNRSLLKTAGCALAAVALCAAVAPVTATAADAVPAAQKDETVYVYTAPDGTVKREEVSTILKNPDGAALLADSTSLSDIEGKGDVAYSGSGDAIVWNADGKDVEYSGATSAEAPVSIRVSYMLDGRDMPAEQMAGKSGHVTIRYDFENLSMAPATVNGVSTSVYTPFTCITALMFDGDDFKNITVDNGKIVNDGADTIVAGYAMPGLKRSLGSMADDADVPDHFTVSADTTRFELKSTMTIVTAGIMSDIDSSSFGIDGIDDASALSDAMGQLISGSEQLAGGLENLAGRLRELEGGTSGILSGAESLSGGLYALAGDDGLGRLSYGAYSLSSAIGQVNEAVQAMRGKLADAASGLSQAVEGAAAFDAAAALLAGYEEAIVGEGKMPEADYQAIAAALTAASQMSAAVGATAGELQAAGGEIDELSSSLGELGDSASALGYGVDTATVSAYQLAGGAEELEGYAEQLNEAVPALAQGAQTAADGSEQLTQGMRAFNDQGVSQLVDTLQNDYGGLLDRVNALSDAAKSYTNFGGITEGTEGSVKFVFETDAITI